jgi:hypothetical protein
MFSLPILDTTLAFARRYVNHRPLFSADKMHFHHQLVARGLTVRRAVMISYALSIFFAIAGAAIVVVRERYAVAFYLVVFGYIVVAAVKIGMVHEKPVVVERQTVGAAEAAKTNLAEPGTVLDVQEEEEIAMEQVPPISGGWAGSTDRD